MKIALFEYAFIEPGKDGLSPEIWSMAQALGELGIEAHLVGPYDEELSAPPGVQVHRYAHPQILHRNVVGQSLLCYLGLRAVQRYVPDADVIQFVEYLSTGIFSYFTDIPMVMTTPGNIYERLDRGANPFDWSMTAALRVAAQRSARYCAKMVAISYSMRDWWVQTGMPAEDIVVMPYGLDTDVFHALPDAVATLGWDPEVRHIVYVGRLSYEKGIDLLLNAYAQLLQEFDDLHLHILGSGQAEAELKALTQQLGLQDSTTYYGWVDRDDLARYYSAGTMFVMPSRSEPLGRVALEAMACQTPVIGANTGGIPDMVKEGETGLLFEVDDTAGLTQQMRRILTDDALRKHIIARADEYIQTEQSWQAVMRRYVAEVYRPIIAARTAAAQPESSRA